MLHASGLVKSFGGFQALAGCSLEIARQSITGIIGPNGAGKSTLFNVLGGLMLPEAGDVTFDGRSILRLRPDERARIGVVRTFQISRELGELTVLENMLLASPHQYGEDLWRCFLMPSRVRDQERAAVAKARARLEQVNLWPLADEQAKNLSGGQKKLLEISRALMLEPKIILLDEPTAGVSPVMTQALGEGAIVTIIGPNGSGKSTLIKTLAGLLPARQGEIELEGERLNDLSPPKRVRAGIAYVPQEYNVFRNLTVLENLKIAREFMGAGRSRERVLDDEVAGLFPELAAHHRTQAGNLSGGQRQMLAFACALTVRPKVLMLDEPSAGLSPKHMGDVFDKVQRVNAIGVSILLVEQNAREALRISHTCIVLAGGRVRAVAPANEVLGMKDLNSLYLGDATLH